MQTLQPIHLQDRYFLRIEKEIRRIFDELIYKPLLRALDPAPYEMVNAGTGNALVDAVRAGTVWHRDGHFYGHFNARISKALKDIGAKYNPKSVTWSLVGELLPVDVRMAQAAAESRFNNLRRRVIRTIDDMNIESINLFSKIPDRILDTVDWMEGDFQKTLKAITIVPKLTQEQRNIITAEWSQNLDKYIKDWAAENILKLRQTVETNAFDGRRSPELAKVIQQNYGVSAAKAKFLARQETSLLLSKLRETRYLDAGLSKYKWGGANDARERPDHKLLNGTIQLWSSPPVTNRKTGARNHPGEDFGCRCVAIPVVE